MPGEAGGRDAGGGDHPVAGAVQRGAEHGADPAGADDADRDGPAQPNSRRDGPSATRRGDALMSLIQSSSGVPVVSKYVTATAAP